MSDTPVISPETLKPWKRAWDLAEMRRARKIERWEIQDLPDGRMNGGETRKEFNRPIVLSVFLRGDGAKSFLKEARQEVAVQLSLSSSFKWGPLQFLIPSPELPLLPVLPVCALSVHTQIEKRTGNSPTCSSLTGNSPMPFFLYLWWLFGGVGDF